MPSGIVPHYPDCASRNPDCVALYRKDSQAPPAFGRPARASGPGRAPLRPPDSAPCSPARGPPAERTQPETTHLEPTRLLRASNLITSARAGARPARRTGSLTCCTSVRFSALCSPARSPPAHTDPGGHRLVVSALCSPPNRLPDVAGPRRCADPGRAVAAESPEIRRFAASVRGAPAAGRPAGLVGPVFDGRRLVRIRNEAWCSP